MSLNLYKQHQLCGLQPTDLVKLTCGRQLKSHSLFCIVSFSEASDTEHVTLLSKENFSSSWNIRSVKWIAEKDISAIDFSLDGEWLLAVTQTGRITISPVNYIFNKFQGFSEAWSRTDLTYLKNKLHRNVATCVKWWQTHSQNDVGLFGTKTGFVIMCDLRSGEKLKQARVHAHIAHLDIATTTDSMSSFCFITSETGNQWKLLIEEKKEESGATTKQEASRSFLSVNTQRLASKESAGRPYRKVAQGVKPPGLFEPTKLFQFPQSVKLRCHTFGERYLVSAYDTSTGKLQLFEPGCLTSPLYMYMLPRGAVSVSLTESLIYVAYWEKVLEENALEEVTDLLKDAIDYSSSRIITPDVATGEFFFSAGAMPDVSMGPSVLEPSDSVPDMFSKMEKESDAIVQSVGGTTSHLQLKLAIINRHRALIDPPKKNTKDKPSHSVCEPNRDATVQVFSVSHGEGGHLQTFMKLHRSDKSLHGPKSLDLFANVQLYLAKNECLPSNTDNSRLLQHSVEHTFYTKCNADGVLDRWSMNASQLTLLPDIVLMATCLVQPRQFKQELCLEDQFLHHLLDEEDNKTADDFGVAYLLDMSHLYEMAALYLARNMTPATSKDKSIISMEGLTAGSSRGGRPKPGIAMSLEAVKERSAQYRTNASVLEYFDVSRTSMDSRIQCLNQSWSTSECLRYVLQLLRRPDQLSAPERRYLANTAIPMFAKVLNDVQQTNVLSLVPQTQTKSTIFMIKNKFHHFVTTNFHFNELDAIQILLRFGQVEEAFLVAKERGAVLFAFEELISNQWSPESRLPSSMEEREHYFLRYSQNKFCQTISAESLVAVLHNDVDLFSRILKDIRDFALRDVMTWIAMKHWGELLDPLIDDSTSVVASFFSSLQQDLLNRQASQRKSLITIHSRHNSTASSITSVDNLDLEFNNPLKRNPLSAEGESPFLESYFQGNDAPKEGTRLGVSDLKFSHKRSLALECFETFIILYTKLVGLRNSKELLESNPDSSSHVEELYFIEEMQDISFLSEESQRFLSRMQLSGCLPVHTYDKVTQQFASSRRQLDINRHILCAGFTQTNSPWLETWKINADLSNEDGSKCTISTKRTGGFLVLGLPIAELWDLEISPLLSGCPTDSIAKIISVSLGQHHAVLLDDNGNVYSCGNNRLGQLGVDSECFSRKLVKVPLPYRAVQVCAGAYHSGAIVWTSERVTPESTELVKNEQKVSMNEFEVFMWGWGVHGQLGLKDVIWGAKGYLNTPLPLLGQPWGISSLWDSSPDHVVQLAMGVNHTLFLTKKGLVYGCGGNQLQQMGKDQPFIKVIEPSRLPFITEKGKLISTKYYQNFCVTETNRVLCWGIDPTVQQFRERTKLSSTLGGNGTKKFRTTASKRVEEIEAAAGVFVLTVDPSTPLLSDEKLIQLASGSSHCLFLTNQGRVFSHGRNRNGQCGLGNRKDLPTTFHLVKNLPKVTMIGADDLVSVAMSSSSKQIFFWGNAGHRVMEGIMGLGQCDLTEPLRLGAFTARTPEYTTQISVNDECDYQDSAEQLMDLNDMQKFTHEKLFHYFKECLPLFHDVQSMMNFLKRLQDFTTIADVLLLRRKFPQSLYWRLIVLHNMLVFKKISMSLLDGIFDYYVRCGTLYEVDKVPILSLLIKFYRANKLPMNHLEEILLRYLVHINKELMIVLCRKEISRVFSVTFLVAVAKEWYKCNSQPPNLTTFTSQMSLPIIHLQGHSKADDLQASMSLERPSVQSDFDKLFTASMESAAANSNVNNVARPLTRQSSTTTISSLLLDNHQQDEQLNPILTSHSGLETQRPQRVTTTYPTLFTRKSTSVYNTKEDRRLVIFACGHKTTLRKIREVELPALLERLRRQNLNLSVQFMQKMFMQDNKLPACIICLRKHLS